MHYLNLSCAVLYYRIRFVIVISLQIASTPDEMRNVAQIRSGDYSMLHEESSVRYFNSLYLEPEQSNKTEQLDRSADVTEWSEKTEQLDQTEHSDKM